MINIPQYKFRELRMNTPWDNLTTAIGLIQAQILAEETSLNPECLFGLHHFKRSSLEAAVALLAAMTGEVEEMKWGDDHEPA